MSDEPNSVNLTPIQRTKAIVQQLSEQLTALGQVAENSGHKPGETLLPADLSQLHSLADQMADILRRAT